MPTESLISYIEQNFRNTVVLLLLAVNLQTVLLAFHLKTLNHRPWLTHKAFKGVKLSAFCVPKGESR